MDKSAENETNKKRILYNTRMVLELSTLEAGQLVGVSARSWENWERRPESSIPDAKFELFCLKTSGVLADRLKAKELESEQLLATVVVFAPTSADRPGNIPIDVVAGSNFVSLKSIDARTAVIKSLAVHPITHRPYVHATVFECVNNKHVLQAVESWRSVTEN